MLKNLFMNNFKKILILFFICTFFIFSQKSLAVTASKVVDKSIDYTAKTTYFVTKYTLKTGCFIVKKLIKGVYLVSKSVFNGTKDAFKSNKPMPKAPPELDSGYTLPQNSKLYNLPPAPKINSTESYSNPVIPTIFARVLPPNDKYK